MNARVDTTNRVVLTGWGLVLLAAGVLGLVASFGGFGPVPALLPPAVRSFAAGQPWFWWAVAALCLVLALLGLRWLLAQAHTDRIGRLDLTTDDREGLTVLHGSAFTDAVEAEAGQLRGVSAVTARLRQRRGRRLTLGVDLADYADIAEVRSGLEERVVGHARQALDDPELPVDIELRPASGRPAGRGLR
ncbi:alkaline shock response membrane anchor protein AmaP [Geodermatophilus nigrescens]